MKPHSILSHSVAAFTSGLRWSFAQPTPGIRLRGTVATEQLKKQAETAVRQAASGVSLENQLTVALR